MMIKRIQSMSKGEKSALQLELRQNRLKLHQRNTELKSQLKEITEELEKNKRRLRDIEASLDNLEHL